MKALQKKGVVFIGCENTLRCKKIDKKKLYEFVQTVPSGLAEVIRKQQSGWSYLKIGH